MATRRRARGRDEGGFRTEPNDQSLPLFVERVARQAPTLYEAFADLARSPSAQSRYIDPPPATVQKANFNRPPLLANLPAVPAAVRVCLDRSQRQEVLFARNVAGKRGGSPGPYKRSWKSKIKC